MTPKIKNILIFGGIGLVLVLVYVFFLKPAPSQPSLTSTSDTTNSSATDATGNSTTDANSAITQDFLTLLLNVKSITLNDSIFSDPAFNSLQDSSIILTPDGTQGRPNPFAPIGVGDTSSPAPAVSTAGGDGLLAPAQIDTKTGTTSKTTSKTTTKTGTTATQ